jgi:hypothetical protein
MRIRHVAAVLPMDALKMDSGLDAAMKTRWPVVGARLTWNQCVCLEVCFFVSMVGSQLR